MASIPLLHSSGHLTFGVLLALVFAIGIFLAPSFSAQRLILPELLGEDERVVAQGNALLEGVQRVCALAGPATAGVLIAVLSPANVLYVDAATFVVSAATIALFVPARPVRAAGEEGGHGLLAGVRFLLRDRLLAVLGGCALVVNMLGQMLVAALPVLAYESFGGSSRVAGAFFAAFGAGAVAGSLVAIRILPRVDPVRLGAAAFVALTLPIFALVAELPAWGVVAALFASAFFGPLVNAPLIGVITTRTPVSLRPKVLTALVTFAMLAGPVGLFLGRSAAREPGPAHAVRDRRRRRARRVARVRDGRLPPHRAGVRAGYARSLTTALIDSIDEYCDAVPRRAARAEAHGPFVLFVKEGEGWPYYARPARGAVAEPTAEDVHAVRGRQRELGLPEAFEWIDDVSPLVRQAAVDGGLRVADHPLMVHDDSTAPAQREPGGGCDRPHRRRGRGHGAGLLRGRARLRESGHRGRHGRRGRAARGGRRPSRPGGGVPARAAAVGHDRARGRVSSTAYRSRPGSTSRSAR
jgi:hypothetical protein